MGATQVVLEIALLGLLGATLFHALRLERALGVIRRDRAELEGLMRGFNDSTRQAEGAIERLRSAAEGGGRLVARQIEGASALKDDLGYLVERGEALAERIDALVRTHREVEAPTLSRHRQLLPEPAMAEAGARVRSQAERDLLRALRVSR